MVGIFNLISCTRDMTCVDMVTDGGEEELVLFELNHVFRIVWMVVLVLIACMMVLELTGLAGLAEVAKESD